MSEFIANPAFWPGIERALERGMDEAARLMKADASRRADDWSSRAAQDIRAEVKRDGGGPYVKFTTGGGFQNLAENPKGPRRTKKGWNRGVMPTHPVMVPSAEDIARHPLPLERYL